jgi:phosphopantothenate synthetase
MGIQLLSKEMLSLLEQVGVVSHLLLTAKERPTVFLLEALEVNSTHQHGIFRADIVLIPVGEYLRVGE